MFTNWSGVGITYDSTEYFAGAKSLAESGAFNAIDGRPQSTWPPGYSFLISVPYRFGMSLEASSLVVAALSLIVIVISTLRILEFSRVSRNKSVAVVALLMISPGLIEASSVALSELAFIASILASITLVATQRGTSIVTLGGILLGFSSLVRYVGIFFIPFIVLLTFVYQRRSSSARIAAVRSGLVLGIAISFPLLWIRRNVRLTGFPTGSREPGGGTFVNALKTALEATGQLILGARFSPKLQFAIGIILITALLAAAVLALFHRSLEIFLLASIPVAYLVFTAHRFVHVEYAPIDLRAFTPTIPFLVLAISIAPWPLTVRKRPIYEFVWVVLSFVLTFGIAEISSKISDAEAWGSEEFQNSNFAKAVRELTQDSIIISNFPQRAFSLTQGLPIRNQYQFDLPPVTTCDRRFGLFFREAPFEGNEPVLASVVYSDDEGSIFDLGNCTIPVKSFWE